MRHSRSPITCCGRPRSIRFWFSDTAKEHWARPRPATVDGRVHPCVGPQTTGSYPSSHASRAVVWAALLAELFPDRRQPLEALGRRIGDDRVVAGIHFPTDVAAGQRLGAALAKALLADPGVRADLARARAEADAFRRRQPSEASRP